jgi:hypothetical protein
VPLREFVAGFRDLGQVIDSPHPWFSSLCSRLGC